MTFLIALTLFLSLANVSVADIAELCAEEKQLFWSCGSVLKDAMMHRKDVALMCRGFASYLDCVNDINIVCPDYADASGLDSTLNYMKGVLDFECPGTRRSEGCSPKLVSRLMVRCQNVAQINRGGSISGGCRKLGAYQTCLSEAAEVCEDSPALDSAGLLSSIEAAEAAIVTQC
ncbi:uncharacterized protein LOC101856039 [Aplysia californica]|uniref:Uncharacterized protein LOC101856039 n=1 Tax=Aplysia californica TaxID=6500 RepID=A0ABM0JX85_APLCA|nr:uncharacterized protein LOC101856039 [Aplysia californica]